MKPLPSRFAEFLATTRARLEQPWAAVCRHVIHPSAVHLAVCALWFCGTAEAAKPDPDKVSRTIILDDTAVKNLRLEIAEATEVPFEDTIFALGRIEILPGKRAVLSSRIAGRALRVSARPDHAVKTGDPLVVVESRQPGDPPSQVTLNAPMDGFVTEMAVAPGQPIDPDKPLLAVVDLTTVYALAAVPEHLADQVRPGQTARITLPGWPGETWESRVEHLGALADAASGTIEAAFHVPNEGLWFRPGMRAEFHFVTRRRPEVLAVPRAAIQGEGANRFVFVPDVELTNAFVKCPVIVGAQNDQFAEIVQGVFPGDPVVTRGSYALSFAGQGNVSLKEALDAAHGHEHNADGSEVSSDPDAKEPQGHNHARPHADASSGPGLSRLAVASLAANAVLLILLAVAARRRGPDGTPIRPAAEGGARDAQ
jgi:membrane fusion protein, heavy metal efflux system